LYPGLCLLEGTNVSEGRGVALPFEVCGAPWIDGRTLAERLNTLMLAGVRARTTRFVPSSDKYAGQMCSGVQFHVTDRNALRPVTLGLHLISVLRDMYPGEFTWRVSHFDQLIGSDQVRLALERGEPVEQVAQSWSETLAEFEQRRVPYLLYQENGEGDS
jgi:uncharacterized protein YbbC (DUF1343 family)